MAGHRRGKKGTVYAKRGSLTAGAAIQGPVAQWRNLRFALRKKETKPQKRNAARDLRWQEGVDRKRAELEDGYERDCNLGLNGHRPTAWEAMISFAYIDVLEHPDDFPAECRLEDGSLDPRFESVAADRMRKAIKRLQIARTKHS